MIGDDEESPPHTKPNLGARVSGLGCLADAMVCAHHCRRLVRGWESTLFKEGLFFSKAAVVTFGGAYAVLPYVAQQALFHYGWLKPGQMMDGLGLAETTPGPLIMVLQFVGFIGRVAASGRFAAAGCGHNWRADHNMGHIHAVLSLDFPGRPLHRTIAR